MDTKTHDHRELPILGEVREMLQRRYEDRIDDGQVFPIGKDSLLRRLRKAQAMAGIEDKELCFHTLRHQAATELFARGAELPVVMAVMGHKNPSTSMRYAHATKEGVETRQTLLYKQQWN
jgi:integrase